ncbi:MAG: MBL fold metallo-hydrolase [Betaproteobacteria bacterium]|nr:MBL fold metallo-hydrolase [Betaproteobacteria bacterium]
MLRFRSLGSGSAGNALLVQAHDGLRTSTALIDCGLGIRRVAERAEQAGVELGALDAIFITHEHADHIGSALALAQRERVPLWMSRGTWAAIGSPDIGPLLNLAADGQTIDVGGLRLAPFTVPHDAREPLQLMCTDGAARLGVLTDLGHVSSHARKCLAGCHALMLECNHDEALLAAGPYPAFLKARVGGLWGHLSNAQAAQLLAELAHPGLRHVVAAHLSELMWNGLAGNP